MIRRGLVIGLVASACATESAAPAPMSMAPPSPSPAPISASAAFADEAAAIRQMGETPNWTDVADRMERFVREYPRFGLGWYNLGVAFEGLGDVERAKDAYRRALAVDEGMRDARINLASLAMDGSDRDTAVELLETVVQQDPTAVDARVALAKYRLEQGGDEEAERLAKEALSRAPERLGAYCVLSQIYARRKQAGRTRLLVAQGFNLHPKAACLQSALGRVLLNEGDTSAGLATLERAVAADPQLSEARFLIAEASMSFKDFQRAITHYRAIAEQAPSSGAAWLDLGVAYKGSGQFEEAEKAYRKAAGLEASAAAAHFNLGVLYLRHLDRLAAAQTEFRQYMSLAGADDREALALLEEAEQLQRFQTAAAEESAPTPEVVATDPPAKVASEPSDESPQAPKPAPTAAEAPKAETRNSPIKKPPPAKKPVLEVPEPDDFE